MVNIYIFKIFVLYKNYDTTVQASQESKKNKKIKEDPLDWIILDKKFLDDYHINMKKILKNTKNILQKIKDNSRLMF